MLTNPRTFTGNGEQLYNTPAGKGWSRREPYIAGEKLTEAVNAALFLKRPLLVEGDPGVGKTRLAYAAAWELNRFLYDCYVRSSSRAEELLYEFDQLTRLYDIQAAQAECQVTGVKAELKDKNEYIRWRPLGQAVRDARDGIPSVVLIDEIDKGDIDFPNDLLQILEEWRFSVKEIENKDGEMLEINALEGKTAEERDASLPLVIITSNREKELPPAFLRRCLYFYISFPGPEKLLDILNSHFKRDEASLFSTAVARFTELRDAFKWRKAPGTSELIDWVKMLEEKNEDAARLAKTPLHQLPSRETLVKHQADREELAKLEQRG